MKQRLWRWEKNKFLFLNVLSAGSKDTEEGGLENRPPAAHLCQASDDGRRSGSKT